MKRVLRPGGRIAIGEPMLTGEIPEEEALRLYGEDDSQGFRACFRTLEWTVALAEQTELSVLSAFHHPHMKRFWEEYYAKLLDERGEVKEENMNRKEEVDIWKEDGGKYHSLGVIVLGL